MPLRWRIGGERGNLRVLLSCERQRAMVRWKKNRFYPGMVGEGENRFEYKC